MSAGGRSTRRRRRRATLALLAVSLWLVPIVASATIEEQRARLPPPAECDDDPVAGVWKSHQYDPRYGDWTVFMLRIRRVEGDERRLVGTITNHSWAGTRAQEEPTPCGSFGWQWVVSMDARGSVSEDGRIAFGGVGQWRLDQVICERGPHAYNLDNFTGVIDRELNEFQSVNNDGGRAVNDPTVFRRVSCFESPPAPHVRPEPPAFYPDMDTGGCGL